MKVVSKLTLRVFYCFLILLAGANLEEEGMFMFSITIFAIAIIIVLITEKDYQ